MVQSWMEDMWTCGRGFMDKFSWTRFLILQEFRRLDFMDEVLWMVLVDYKFIIFIKRWSNFSFIYNKFKWTHYRGQYIVDTAIWKNVLWRCNSKEWVMDGVSYGWCVCGSVCAIWKNELWMVLVMDGVYVEVYVGSYR